MTQKPQELPGRVANYSPWVLGRLRWLVARALVAFGAACAGLFVGFFGVAVVFAPLVGPSPSTADLAAAAAVGCAVMGAIGSLAVEVDPLL